MLNNQYTVFTAVSLATLLAACGGVDTTSPSTTGSGGSATSASGGTAGGSTGTGPDCMAPQQACGGSCIDTSGDTANCGSCAHSCQGGACVGSRCQPVTIATGQNQVFRIAANASGVYWGMKDSQTTTVMMFPAAGGALIPLALGLDNSLSGLVADEKNVYWTQNKSVMTVPIGGGNVKTLATAMQFAPGIAVDSTSVYWADQYVGMKKMPIGGGSPTTLTTANISIGVSWLAVDTTSLYWQNLSLGNSSISKVPIAGGVAKTLASAIDPGEIVVDKKNVYWVGQSSKQINAIPVDGGPVTVLGMTPYPPLGLAQDEANLYISSNDVMGAILKVPKTGGDPQVIAAGHGFVQSLAVDATSVYWQGNDGIVSKVAK